LALPAASDAFVVEGSAHRHEERGKGDGTIGGNSPQAAALCQPAKEFGKNDASAKDVTK